MKFIPLLVNLVSVIIYIFLMDIAGLTISGDGTTGKHLNYESKHGLLIMPTYSSDPNTPIMNMVPT